MSGLVLYSGVVVLLAIDAGLYWHYGSAGTMSAWVMATRSRSAVAAFLLGCLFGHWFLR